MEIARRPLAALAFTIACSSTTTDEPPNPPTAADAATMMLGEPREAGTARDSATTHDVATIPLVGSCTSLGASGTWENVTPAQLKMAQWCNPQGNDVCPGAGNVSLADVLGSYTGKIATYGIHYFERAPTLPGTVYLGTSSLGMWKSTDCGATWIHVNTGKNGDVLDAGRNWSIVIDPTDANVIYTVAGYGVEGVWKSTNAGVDWTQILPKSVLDITGNGFVEKITMDPTDHTHLVVSFHTSCTGTPIAGAASDGSGWACLAETFNADTAVPTFSMTTNGETWSGSDGPGQTMVDRTTWYYGSNGDGGLWRTTTGGVSVNGNPAWTKVFPGATFGGVYVASDHSLYLGAYGGELNHSLTGDLNSWTSVASHIEMLSMNGSIPITDDGTTLYASKGSYGPGYFSGPLASPSSIKAMTVPASMTQGGSRLDYEAANHIVYSSNMGGGFWRMSTK